jgi:hypothetical protein
VMEEGTFTESEAFPLTSFLELAPSYYACITCHFAISVPISGEIRSSSWKTGRDMELWKAKSVMLLLLVLVKRRTVNSE